MPHESFTVQHRRIGQVSAWAMFGLGVIYLVTTAFGLLSLRSPQDPIGDPYFSMMELLIVLMAPFMILSVVTIHAYAAPTTKAYSLPALILMSVAAGITASIHFVILTVSRPLAAAGLSGVDLLLSFKWPSVAYALDILAWDFFFALSVLFAALVFRQGRLEAAVRILLLVSGVLSLLGLIGVPLADMQVRLIGVVGYAVVLPFAFLMLAILFGRSQQGSR